MRLLTKSLRQKFTRTAGARPLLGNEDGSAAIEFGMVALPFLMFVLGIIAFGLYFLSSTFLSYGVEVASRQIRTGLMNTAGPKDANDQPTEMSVKQFRQDVCTAASPVIDCSKLSVKVAHWTSWADLTPESCTDADGNMTGSTGEEGDLLKKYAGEASDVVLVTLCYKWDLAESLSLLKMGSGPDGSGPAIIQAATAFKSEPYN